MVDKVSDKPGLALRAAYVIAMIVAVFTRIGGIDLTYTIQGQPPLAVNMTVEFEPFRECWNVTGFAPSPPLNWTTVDTVMEQSHGPPCAGNILEGTGEAVIVMLSSFVLYCLYRMTTGFHEDAKVHSWRYAVEYVYDWVVFISAAVAVGYAVHDYNEPADVHGEYVARVHGENVTLPTLLSVDSKSHGPGFIMLCIALVSSAILAALSFKANPLHRYHPAHHSKLAEHGAHPSKLEDIGHDVVEAAVLAALRPKAKAYELVYV